MPGAVREKARLDRRRQDQYWVAFLFLLQVVIVCELGEGVKTCLGKHVEVPFKYPNRVSSDFD